MDGRDSRIRIEKEGKEPLYLQLADRLSEMIREGQFRKTDRLPSERQLCAMTGLSRDTVKEALRVLRDQGMLDIVRGSGSHIISPEKQRAQEAVRRQVSETVQHVKQSGMSRRQAERSFIDAVWNSLPEKEQLHIAWIDCSMEILEETARKLANQCHIRVTPLLLADVEKTPSIAEQHSFDLLLTTINHYDDLLQVFEKKLQKKTGLRLEKIVLGIDRKTISELVQPTEKTRTVILYESEWYRSNMERYLNEFAVKGKHRFVRIRDASAFLQKNRGIDLVILPEDYGFCCGLVGELEAFCRIHGISCLTFRQSLDDGSYLYLRKLLQQSWIKKAVGGKMQAAEKNGIASGSR